MRTICPAFGLHGRLLLAVIAGLAISDAAPAHTFCVSTASALQSALTASSVGGTYNDEDNVIQLVQGTYMTPVDGFHSHSTAAHSLLISGGFTNAQCSVKVENASLVKLDGHGATGVLSIGNANGYVGVLTLTIQNGDSGLGAGLQINYLAQPNNAVAISDVVLRNNHSNADAGGLYATAIGMFVSDTVMVGNSADVLYGGGYLTSYGGTSFAINNTVARNMSGGAGNAVGGLYVGGSTEWVVYKNIFWNNSGVGFYIGNSTTQMLDNDYGSIGGMAPTSNAGHASVSPKFVDADNGDFHLAGDSPLLGYSIFLGDSDVDVEGHAPPSSGAMDLGAYYDTIFVDRTGDD